MVNWTRLLRPFPSVFFLCPPVVLEIHPITRTPLWGIATLSVLPVRVVACTLPKESNLTYVVKSIQVKLKDTESLAFLECAPSTPVDTIVDLHNVNCSSSIITRLPSLIDVTSTLSISFCCDMVHFWRVVDVYFLLNHNNNQVLFSEVSKSSTRISIVSPIACSNVVLQVVANIICVMLLFLMLYASFRSFRSSRMRRLLRRRPRTIQSISKPIPTSVNPYTTVKHEELPKSCPSSIYIPASGGHSNELDILSLLCNKHNHYCL